MYCSVLLFLLSCNSSIANTGHTEDKVDIILTTITNMLELMTAGDITN